ncbi:MAG: hypothetical protein JNK28_06720 [Burkholderiaceae bacterium]|jgi:hypothetical protein|nr:hypothetical protein [Burkholderiaceae bacterium]
MEVLSMLFDSKYGVAALGSVTLAVAMLASTFIVLAQKAARTPDARSMPQNDSGR